LKIFFKGAWLESSPKSFEFLMNNEEQVEKRVGKKKNHICTIEKFSVME
jgi:hypothetical protein